MSNIYIGLDTSNYRTSLAAVNGQSEVLFFRAELLDVKKGERGLRQSEAFFAHSNRLPGMIGDLFDEIDPSVVAAIGVSSRPRRVEGSYMPCFLAGLNAAKLLGSSLKAPVYSFSHQEGHAAAVLGENACRTLFMHLSGGTTEFLKCSPDEEGYSMEICGGTKDISVGQLLDRAGVALGFPFPSGQYLDDAAYGYLESTGFDLRQVNKPAVLPKIKTEDGYFNLSGAETKLLRHIEKGIAPEDIPALAAELFISITELLLGSYEYLTGKYGTDTTVMAGGVASSRTVRRLTESSGHGSEIIFGRPDFSGDNAAGTALLAKRRHEAGKRIAGK